MILGQLLAAVGESDLPKVRGILTKHPYLFNFELPRGWPILHQCLHKPGYPPCADVDLVKLFVDNGGDVNRLSGSRVSLLFLATNNSFARDIAAYLTRCGAKMRPYEQATVALTAKQS